MTSVLDQPTLVLNKNWTAIEVQPVRDAINTVCRGGAEVLDPTPDYFQTYTWADWAELSVKEGQEFIRCPDKLVRVPEVIVLTHYEKVRNRELVFNRRNLFARDDNTCQYCSKRMNSRDCTIDHVIPTCQGGKDDWFNCVIACVKCNVRKGGRTPRQAGMKLIRTPFKPRWSPAFRSKVLRPSWRKVLPDFDALMSEMYWQVKLK